MRRFTARLIAFCLFAVMLAGVAIAAAPGYPSPPPFPGAFIHVTEGYYTADGVYVPPGYYFSDGSFVPDENTDPGVVPSIPPSDDPEPSDPPDVPTVPQDPDTPVDPEDPRDPEDPEDPIDPENPEDPENPQNPENPGLPGIPDVPGTDPEYPAPQLDPELSKQIVRIGLRYGSDAMDGANLGNSVGSGFRFGYYNSDNKFISVGYTSKTTISVVKTENVYYGTYNGYATYYDHLTNSNIGVGCYHLQLGGSYNSFESANSAATQYKGGFVAYINGKYYVRIGNYLNRDAAVAAQNDYAASGVSTELKGTSSYGISVVVKGTNTIIFQYDDNGNGTGLGVEPIAASSSQKCVSTFAGVDYFGGFRYERIDGGNLTIVNMLGVDDYVKGVICEEMSSSWELEALKAQAVVARSYVLHNANRHKAYNFDACTTSHCQVYSGRKRAAESTDLAVDSTMGVVARYDGAIINSVFYSSNGGASESSSTVWGSSQSKYPYLIGKEDPYEATIKISNEWTRTYTGAEIAAMLREAGYTKCSKIVSVNIREYTPSGNPAWIDFTDDQGRVWQLNAKTANSALPLRSWRYEFVNTEKLNLSINGVTSVDALTGLFAVDENGNIVPVQDHAYIITDNGTISSDGSGPVTGDSFTIAGRGWGHNVGMSQYGAQAMAKLGYTYDQILRFYYTGITVG